MKVIALDDNYGYAGGYNVRLNILQQSTGDSHWHPAAAWPHLHMNYFVLLNSDVPDP